MTKRGGSGGRTRAERLSMPLARDVVKDLAVEHGACIRPVQLRRTDLAHRATEPVLVPCGHTLASVCPLVRRAGQEPAGRTVPEGWHLDPEPVIEPDEPTTSNCSGSKSAPTPS